MIVVLGLLMGLLGTLMALLVPPVPFGQSRWPAQGHCRSAPSHPTGSA